MNVRVLAVVMLSACSPILTPVVGRQPLVASTHPPRIIWLFDQSGSMLLPLNPLDSRCPAGCGPGNRCPSTCPTREDQFREGVDAMAAVLPETVTSTAIRYPLDALCGAPGSDALEGAQQNLTAAQLHTLLSSYAPAGGTPTAATLRYVARLPPLVQTETLVVLVTDGLPNCNDTNPYQVCTPPVESAALAACRCTTATCTGALCSLGCLDDLAMVSASHLLAERGMNLMVVGLGAEAQLGIFASTLGAMEIGLSATCTSSADCDGRACGGDGVCADRIYIPTSSAGFAAPAQRLGKAARVAERCTFWLPRQVAASDLSVELGGELLEPSQWTLKGEQEQRVVISGAACDRLIAGDESVSFSVPPSN